MAALLWYDGFPSARVILLGLLSAFAGYTAVYALNDMVDRRVNRAALEGRDPALTRSLDSVAGRHPVATGRLSTRAGWTWVGAWAAVSLVSAYLLGPACAVIFVGGCLLEALYCSLYRVTSLRALVSGVIKTLGAAAAVFAVDANPSAPRLALLLGMIFLWELGGQNIPSDWSDIEEDRRMRARTLPLALGATWSAVLMIACMTAAMGLSIAVLRVFSGRNDLPFIAAFLAAGIGLLIYPSLKLSRHRDSSGAALVFHAASFYPLALLVIVAVKMLASLPA